MSRDEHLEFCKQRARAYFDAGDVVQGITSFLSDLTKHEGTRDHTVRELAFGLLLTKPSLADARSVVEGTN